MKILDLHNVDRCDILFKVEQDQIGDISSEVSVQKQFHLNNNSH